MIRRAPSIYALTAVIAGMLVTAGCGGATQGAAAEAGKKAPEAAAQDVREVKHAMGVTQIKGTPERVVTLYQAATDAALQLGVKPVGAVEAWIEQPWYNYIRDRMQGVTNLGSENQPNLEAIIALKPDLIIGSKSRDEKIYDQLSAIAPTVMDEDVYFWKAALSLSAEAMNKKPEEQRFLADWQMKVDDFKKKMGDKLKMEVAIVDFRPDHARIVYTGFSALVLDELGVSRPMNQKGEEWGIKLTSKENIPQMDADIIFDQTSTSRSDGRMDLRLAWTSHPLWKNLRAVKTGKVFPVDSATWNNGSGPIAAAKMLEDLYRYYDLK
ncbi:ABC transporter substrate-binding protein [Paenibacillus thalictri]|uniref:Iron-siderophore ABC transporter substrate-binding protein n=1 Tax=Paenibacillus thalictri TaxID=2527873 RepID=A0A4Q9DJM3_9BACL|nr:iron-siderophore ABC transporter substrate-binding protein [Paenibacillus thalictri]TBL74589.1 iron-siderophore ABC transporter substrate-binding protein [Paenibacillus thalictri]